MYRNLHYNIQKGYIRLWSWDENGKRISSDIPFNPYIYLETESNADSMSIFNTKLKKRYFKNEWERKKYIKESGLKRIFFNLPPEQQFLIDHFKFENSKSEFSKHPLKIFYLDIEVYSPDEFPEADLANKEINIITIYDSIDGKYHSWGTSGKNGGDFIAPQNVVYTKCKSERELLIRFLDYWRKDFPDIVTGWNSTGFDLPYIINRLNNVFGEDRAKLLSPINQLFKKENVLTKFGKVQDHWYIKGVSHIDYMEAYKVFERENRASYSLNYIGKLELKEGKVEIPTNELHTLADTNWQKFCEYNIQDVTIIVKLEMLKHYLQIVRTLSYMGYTSFEKALGTVAMVTGCMAVKALENDMIIPTFEHKQEGTFEGGFVMEPKKGINESIVSFDANSLYPNTIISANISPETKTGKIIKNTNKDEVTLELVNGKRFTLTPEQFMSFVEKEELAITKAKVLYSQKKKGFCPKVIDDVYKQRVEFRDELKKLQKEKEKLQKKIKTLLKRVTDNVLPQELTDLQGQLQAINNKIVELDVLQYTYKIFLNKIYGTFGNKHSPFYDVDAASSVTMTGQACVKESSNIVQKYMQDKGITEKCVIYMDTDSCFLTIDPVLKKMNIPFAIDNVPTEKTYEISSEIEKYINTEILEWAKSSCNMKDPRFVFKREKLCNSGIFLEKKKYILHLLDKEGVLTDKIAPTGVELVKIEIPKKVRPLMMNVVDVMLRTRDYKKTNDAVKELYNKFIEMEPEEIAKTVSIKQMAKYKIKCNGLNMAKRVPMHTKSALYYNYLLNELKLTNKYEKIEEGIHMKMFYVEPNKYNLETMGFITTYPKEFGINVDKNKTFNRNIYPAILRMYEAVGWRLVNPSTDCAVDLIDFLS